MIRGCLCVLAMAMCAAGVPVTKSPHSGLHKLTACSTHKHCHINHFCSALATHKNKCLPCELCKRAIDSVTKKCPLRCMPPLGSPCAKHESCKTKTEFCSVQQVKGKETAQSLAKATLPKKTPTEGHCHPCQYCDKAKDSITGNRSSSYPPHIMFSSFP